MKTRQPRSNVTRIAVASVGCLVLGWGLMALAGHPKGPGAFFLLMGVLLGVFGVAYYFAWTPPSNPREANDR